MQTSPRKLLRLGLPMLLAWSLAWVIGIGILAKVAIDLRAELRDSGLDTRLSLYTMAVYGLTWFDSSGTFHGEVLRYEPEFNAPPYDIWVIEANAPHTPPITHLAPHKPQFALQAEDLLGLLPTVMGKAEKTYRNGLDQKGAAYRLYAIPTYLDQAAATTPKAMIVVIADPIPGRLEYDTFVHRILLVTAFLGVIGLLVGAILTWWSLRPAVASLKQRERFLSATAHELRTPMAALRTICESAQKGDEAPEQAFARMGRLLQTTSYTLEDLLLFARLDAGAALERQAVRLDLLTETLLPEDSRIQLQATASTVQLDPRLASVAIRNLLENAQRHGNTPDEHLRVIVAGSQVIVEDQGSGYSAALLAQTGRDFSISPSQGGTGLGLAIANRVAKLHGGTLHLENIHPQGARATLTFGA